MAFRDDNEALRAQAEALRQELAEERSRALAAEREAEQRAASLRQELEQAKAALQAERRRTTRPSQLRWLAITALVMAGAGFGIAIVRRHTPKEQVAAVKRVSSPPRPERAPRGERKRGAAELASPLREAERRLRFGHPRYSRGMAQAALATAWTVDGDRARAAKLVHSARKSLDEGEERARSQHTLGRVASAYGWASCAVHRADPTAAAELAAKAETLLKRVVAFAHVAEAALAASHGCSSFGRPAQALRWVERALEAAQQVTAHYKRPDLLLAVADRLIELRAPATRLDEVAKALRQSFGKVSFDRVARLAQLGQRYVRVGRKKIARQLLQEVEQRGSRYSRKHGRAAVAHLLALLGQRKQARALLGEAFRDARRAGSAGGLRLSMLVGAHVALGQLEEAAGLSRKPPVMLLLSEAYLARGQREKALSAARHAGEYAPRALLRLARAGMRSQALAAAAKLRRSHRRAIAVAMVYTTREGPAEKAPPAR